MEHTHGILERGKEEATGIKTVLGRRDIDVMILKREALSSTSTLPEIPCWHLLLELENAGPVFFC